MSKSFLEESLGGIYTPGLRYAFTNITSEEFMSQWSKVPIVVKAGETIELSDSTPLPGTAMGQVLAIKMTGELVDKIMIGAAKLDEVSYYKNNPGAQVNTYRSSKVSSLGVPAARRPLEEQILRQLEVDEESPTMQLLRQQVMQDIQAGAEGKGEDTALPRSIEEFAEIKEGPQTTKVVEEKKPAKTKKIA